MNTILTGKIGEAETIALFGHIHPDGDSVGSVLGLYRYLKDNYPEKTVDAYLEEPQSCFSYMKDFEALKHAPETGKSYDLAVALDVSDHERLGCFAAVFDGAKRTLNIDHHVTNPHFAQETVCLPDASSACEVLFGLLEEEKISKVAAECIYTGIVTDTGVFKYNATSAETMRIAGILMEKGIDFGGIIDGAFYMKTFPQQRLLGLALTKAVRTPDGRCIYAVLSAADRDSAGASRKDTDGIAEQLRLTEGVECSFVCNESDNGAWKLSMRSLNKVDVAAIAKSYGGGGHIRAAGCTITGRPEDFIGDVCSKIAEQLNA